MGIAGECRRDGAATLSTKYGTPHTLNDPETGLPTTVMGCTRITAKRTGAATAVAAKYLARKDSTTGGRNSTTE
jgi:ornithine cyclodeaminase/alanine dehydrogenase-like protein (mu-crystallin family)